MNEENIDYFKSLLEGKVIKLVVVKSKEAIVEPDILVYAVASLNEIRETLKHAKRISEKEICYYSNSNRKFFCTTIKNEVEPYYSCIIVVKPFNEEKEKYMIGLIPVYRI